MEVWVFFFTIFCIVCSTIYAQYRLRNGGKRVSWRPRIKTRYLKCVEELRESIKELRKSIEKFPEDCGSMKISREQCKLLRSECLRLVQLTQQHCILKESFCTIRRALKLMQDCCSNDWLLKAMEFGDCQGHFLEILFDLHRLLIVEDVTGFGDESLDEVAAACSAKSEETKKLIHDAWTSDKAALSSMLESEIGPDHPDHCLADQFQENPSLLPPADVGKHVTEFDIFNSPCLYRNGNIFVSRVEFRSKEFVIKMRLSKLGAEDPKDTRMQEESSFMKKCRHPYAVALLGYWEAIRTDCPRAPLLLMESMECDLDSHIERNKTNIERTRRWRCWGGTKGFPALDAISLMLPVAKVMKYLHEIGVVHLDLKPGNILFTQVPGTLDLPEEISVKLADFGCAGKANDIVVVVDGKIPRIGTYGYMDPDMYAQKERVDLVKADVFSFGMVFGEVLTGLYPLDALDCEENPRKFYGKLQRGVQIPLPREIPESVKSIVESCWKTNPGDRPRFDEICRRLQNAEIRLQNL